MKIHLLTGLIFLTVLLTFTHIVLAQTPECSRIFGGGQTCFTHPDLTIDKQVQLPGSNSFSHNLTTEENYFSPQSEITFRINIKNTANGALTNIEVTDILPAQLRFKKGNGRYDFNTSTFSDKITRLEPNQTKTYIITSSVNTSSLNGDLTCMVNNAKAIQNGKTGTDNAAFCIKNDKQTSISRAAATPGPKSTKGGMPIFDGEKTVKKTPPTGPEEIAFLSFLLPALSGFYIRRKSAVKKII